MAPFGSSSAVEGSGARGSVARPQVKDVPVIKGVVRGKMGCSGWVVAPAEGGAASRVTYVSVTDLKVRGGRRGPAHRGGRASERSAH